MSNEEIKTESPNSPELLSARIEELEKEKEELKTENKRLETENKKLKEEAIYDGLTKLKNRKYFIEQGEKIVESIGGINPEQEKRKEGFTNFAVIFCDVDNFKKINDTYGHDFGDEILKEVAGIIEKNVRGTDIVGRLGGEEFVAGLPGADENEAVKIAEKIRIAVEREAKNKYANNPKYKDLKVTLSMGATAFSHKAGLKLEDLIKQGDEAMYMAKNGGKNKVVSYTQVEKNKKQTSLE